MRLTFKSVQQQASASGYQVEKAANGYTVNGQKFRLLVEVADYLNRCLEVSVAPELTVNEVQQLACQMGFLVQPMDEGYGIFYQGQLLGLAKLLPEVVEALPQYKEAIAKYYEQEIADISIEAIVIPGYRLEFDPNSTAGKKTYQVTDSLTQEPLFNVYQSLDGWTSDLTKQVHSSPTLAIAEAREKTIGRIERSRPLEVNQIDSDTFIVCNPDNGNHYAVRPSHPYPQERCECGDAHFRWVRCKHQIAAEDYLEQSITAAIAQAEFNQYIEQQAEDIGPNAQSLTPDIQFTSPDSFYNWDAIANGRTIATIHYDSEHLTQPYLVAVSEAEVHRTNTQARAENYIIWHYKQGTLPIIEVEKIEEPCTIEDCKFVDKKGQQYTFRINNQLIGYIWLADDGGDWYSSLEYWVNGDGIKYDDWRECGLKLAQLTRHDLYQAVAA